MCDLGYQKVVRREISDWQEQVVLQQAEILSISTSLLLHKTTTSIGGY